MSGIRGKDTKPELFVRKALHARGFRYRLGGAGLPGRPDLVFPSRKIAIFIHGCFWHKHECRYFKWPDSNSDFWFRRSTRMPNGTLAPCLILRLWVGAFVSSGNASCAKPATKSRIA
ncbi:very short patch repair endonuclease [Limnohabitans sp.]|uniref:very short patch repair endonuclease n=1 Tax=Limnohabitans sp. TaxID=1907725 RepID=UPI00311E69F9